MMVAMSGNPAFDPSAPRSPVHVGYHGGSASLRQSALVCLLFAVATAVVATVGRGDGMAYVAVVPAAVFLLFAVLTVRAYARRARGRPLLTLDDHGVTLHSARVTLPWDDLREVRILTAPLDVRTVVFVARDEAATLAGLHGLPHQFAKSGMAHVGGPVYVRAHDLAIPLEDLLTAIHGFTGAPINQRYTTRA